MTRPQVIRMRRQVLMSTIRSLCYRKDPGPPHPPFGILEPAVLDCAVDDVTLAGLPQPTYRQLRWDLTCLEKMGLIQRVPHRRQMNKVYLRKPE